jgi:antitoxin YefM
MLNGIRQKATVGKGGRIEFLSPELPMGATVEIIVLIEKSPLETQKERWLRLSADDKQLVQARKEFAAGQWVELEDNDDLDELLKK